MTQEENEKILTISKDELAALPAAEYEGKIVVVDSLDTVDAAVDALRLESEIGFDTETKPSFKRGQSNNVALLQLSSHECCYLFRLNKIGLPSSVRSLLEDEDILKIGLSIHDDFHNLHKLYDLNPGGFVDLQGFVKQYMIADNSLSRIYAILFGHRISKGQRLTNWEADELTHHQQVYASLDAYACIKIYDYLSSGKLEPQSSPYLHDKPIPPKED